MSTNYFRTFDNINNNLYTVGEFGNSTYITNGFKSGDEIPSKVFNSILRQNSLFTKTYIDYMLSNSTSDYMISHISDESTITQLINEFFNTKISTTNISISQIKDSTMSFGTMLYTNEQSLTKLESPNLENNTLSSTSKFRIEYKQYQENNTIPYVRNVKVYDSSNNKFNSVGTSIYCCKIDLTELDTNISDSNKDNYEIFVDLCYIGVFQGTTANYHYQYKFNLNDLHGLNYGAYPGATENLIASDNNYYVNVIKCNDTNVLIGISDDTLATSSKYTYNTLKYLTFIIGTSIEQLKFTVNITLKERI